MPNSAWATLRDGVLLLQKERYPRIAVTRTQHGYSDFRLNARKINILPVISCRTNGVKNDTRRQHEYITGAHFKRREKNIDRVHFDRRETFIFEPEF